VAASDDSSAVVLLPLVQRHSGRAGGADDGFADEDGGLPSSAPCFLSIPALSLVLSPSLFYFGFSSVAAGGSADGGGMAVLDGVAEGHGGERGAAAGNPKMMILFSNFGPENPPCFCFFVNLPCLLSQICSSLQVRFSKVLPHLVSFFFLFLQLARLPLLFLFPPLFFPVSAACFPLLSKKFLLPLLVFPPFSVFCSLPCIYRQPGERFTIPCPSAGHGGVGVAGYGCVGVGMGHAGFLGKWGGREGEVEREKEI